MFGDCREDWINGSDLGCLACLQFRRHVLSLSIIAFVVVNHDPSWRAARAHWRMRRRRRAAALIVIGGGDDSSRRLPRVLLLETSHRVAAKTTVTERATELGQLSV